MPEQEAPPTRRAPHMERYVRVRPFPTEETEDSHKLELVIDNQGFLLSDGASNCHESREAAEWSRDMLCIALNELRSQVIDECSAAVKTFADTARAEGFDGLSEDIDEIETALHAMKVAT